jgi:hypothetical protein
VGNWVGLGDGKVEGTGLGDGEGIIEGLGDGRGVVGSTVGNSVGAGVGSQVSQESCNQAYMGVTDPTEYTSHKLLVSSGGVFIQLAESKSYSA